LRATGYHFNYVTDSEIQPEGRCISERLEKIGGKRQPVVEKIRFQSLFMLKAKRINLSSYTVRVWIPDKNIRE
jgi:hypothetical protein